MKVYVGFLLLPELSQDGVQVSTSILVNHNSFEHKRGMSSLTEVKFK